MSIEKKNAGDIILEAPLKIAIVLILPDGSPYEGWLKFSLLVDIQLSRFLRSYV